MYWAYCNFKVCLIYIYLICLRIFISSLSFFNFLLLYMLIRHLFVDVCECGFCNLWFLFMVVFVCLEVVDFSMMFTCWDFVEPIRYGVCDVYVGCGVGLMWMVQDSFASWYAI